jgi:hypothetical protein
MLLINDVRKLGFLSTGVSMFVLLVGVAGSMLIAPKIKIVSLNSIAKKLVRGYTRTVLILEKIGRNVAYPEYNTWFLESVNSSRRMCI